MSSIAWLIEVKLSGEEVIWDLEGILPEIMNGSVAEFIDGWESGRLGCGAFNKIVIDRIGKLVFCNNDFLGQRPLYYHQNKSGIYLSNNFWRIVECLHKSGEQISVNEDLFRQQLLFRRVMPSNATFVHEIKRLRSNESIRFSLLRGDNDSWRTQTNFFERDVSVECAHVAASELDDKLRQGFSYLADERKGDCFLFGNSGGLDSRLIPKYATEFKLDFSGFLVQRNSVMSTRSELAATKVADLYGFSTTTVDYRATQIYDRLLHDVAVNPMGTAEYHKNVLYDQVAHATILNGGNSFIICNDDNRWRSIDTSQGISAVVASYLSTSAAGIPRSELDTYCDIVHDETKFALNTSDFHYFRNFHAHILNRESPVGAFESMNMGGKDFFYVYYPVLDATTRWHEDLFYDRKVLRAFYSMYMKASEKIADQSGWLPNSVYRPLMISRMLRASRGDGLGYQRWLKDRWYMALEAELLQTLAPDLVLYFNNLIPALNYRDANDILRYQKLMVIFHALATGDTADILTRVRNGEPIS